MGVTRQNGERSRLAIVEAGLKLWADEGQAALTIAALAGRLGMSKAGVFAAFGSKEKLDLAVVEAAAERMARDVVAPADLAPPGVARLAALVEGWMTEVETARPALRVLAERATRRAAQLHGRLRAWRESWQSTLAAPIADAARLGELPGLVSAVHVAFEIDALLMAALRGVDGGERSAAAAARSAIESRLRHLATGDRDRR